MDLIADKHTRVTHIVVHDGPIEVGSKVQVYDVPPIEPDGIYDLEYRVPDRCHSA